MAEQQNLKSIPHKSDKFSFEIIPLAEEPATEEEIALQSSFIYESVEVHWFYEISDKNEKIWKPFTAKDAINIENAFINNRNDPNLIVATDGGRYDVYVNQRLRKPVYWEGDNNDIRRSTWFYNQGEGYDRYIPYPEDFTEKLEECYKTVIGQKLWRKRIKFAEHGIFIFYDPNTILHYVSDPQMSDDWQTMSNIPFKPRIVLRGSKDCKIYEGESKQIDHVIFMVHGIGNYCDLQFRPLVEVVNELRENVQIFSKNYYTSKNIGNEQIGRIEVLPVSWHNALHGEATGIDERLKLVTLPSIPFMRDFMNDAISDAMLFTSPQYCQTIVNAVVSEMNRLYKLFNERNPNFSGTTSIGAHSLGTVISFDILASQEAIIDEKQSTNLKCSSKSPEDNDRNGYFGYPLVKYPKLDFNPKYFFAFGSPIAMFLTLRGVKCLGNDYKLPTCEIFYNIYHPFDPIAYRIEPMVDASYQQKEPVLMHYYKGGKRMHLHIKEGFFKIHSDLKKVFADPLKFTLNQLNYFIGTNQQTTEEEDNCKLNDSEQTNEEQEDSVSYMNEKCGPKKESFNNGKRIDYVLQEKTFEKINQYIFAMQSHLCYWGSKDIALFLCKELYSN